jgi:uncharacterized membrane protein
MVRSIDFLLARGGAGGWSRWPFGPGLEGGWLLMISKFIFIGLVLAGIIWLLRRGFGPGGFLREDRQDEPGEGSGRREALQRLRKRLADGEISPEEFSRRKRALDE